MHAASRWHQQDELIHKLTQIVRYKLDYEQIGVTELAKQVWVKRSHLNCKVLFLAKKSLSRFIMDIRLTEALKILQEEKVTVSEVAYRVGFKHLSYFTACFHEHFGFPLGKVKDVNPETLIQ